MTGHTLYRWRRVLPVLSVGLLLMGPARVDAADQPLTRQVDPDEEGGDPGMDPDSDPVPVGATPRGDLRNSRHIATWNIFGGLGNAYTGFNGTVAYPGLGNTVQTRIGARQPYIEGLALQEVCTPHYDWVKNYLYAQDVGKPLWQHWRWNYYPAIAPAFGIPNSTPLNGFCGSWYGNALFLKGTVTNPQTGAFPTKEPGKEIRGYVCGSAPFFSMCSAHLNPDDYWACPQSNEFRDVATYINGANGVLSLFAAGDYNIRPKACNNWWRASWVFAGFVESDFNCCEATEDGGTAIDYIWRGTGGFTYDAYVSSNSRSDHHWKQAYF